MDKILTKDGSFTLYSKEFDECYHSVNDGALNETLQKHVIPGLNFFSQKSEINILDICFGLGYNTLATIYYRDKYFPELKLNIYSPELDGKLVGSINTLEYPKEFDKYKHIIEKISELKSYQDDNTSIQVHISDAREFIEKSEVKYDLVYQDAFSPQKNPMLWTVEYFNLIKEKLKPEYLLTTYSIATPVRVSMYECGMRIYEHILENKRKATLVSSVSLNDIKEIDMEYKLKVSTNNQPLRDCDYS